MATRRCKLRILLTIANSVLFLLSLTYVILGLHVQALGQKYLPDYRPHGDFWGPWIIFAIAGILGALSCLGCHAASLQSRTLMVLYVAIMTILTIALTTVSALAFTYKNQFRHEVRDILTARLTIYGIHDARYRHAWDRTMSELQCCGVLGHDDWIANEALQVNHAVPDMCCYRTTENCGYEMVNVAPEHARNHIHIDGCLPKLEDLLTKANTMSASIGLTAATLYLITIVTVSFVACTDDKSTRNPQETNIELLDR